MHRKFSAVVALLVVTVVPAVAQGKYDVWSGGSVVGSGKFYVKLAGSGIENYFSMVVEVGGKKQEFAARGLYDHRGAALRESFIEKSDGVAKTTILNYGRTRVEASVTYRGKRTLKRIPYPGGSRSPSPSIFWFVKTTPKVGAKDRGYELDSTTLKFSARTVVYLGKDDVTVPQGTRTGHRISNGEKTFWLDAKGLPLRMDIGPFTWIRR